MSRGASSMEPRNEAQDAMRDPGPSGRLVAVVGPSGVGKDSLIAALAQARPALVVARRAITRPPDPSEPFEGLSEEVFEARRQAGGFILHWRAHGFLYGIPENVRHEIAAGRDVLVNLSRGVLGEARAAMPSLLILSLHAQPEVLARRLADRGREDAAAIRARVAREGVAPPPGVPCVPIDNGGAIGDAVARALAALDERGG